MGRGWSTQRTTAFVSALTSQLSFHKGKYNNFRKQRHIQVLNRKNSWLVMITNSKSHPRLVFLFAANKHYPYIIGTGPINHSNSISSESLYNLTTWLNQAENFWCISSTFFPVIKAILHLLSTANPSMIKLYFYSKFKTTNKNTTSDDISYLLGIMGREGAD